MVSIQKGSELQNLSPNEHAALMYIEMIKTFVSGRVFRNAELSVQPRLTRQKLSANPFNEGNREGGGGLDFCRGYHDRSETAQ